MRKIYISALMLLSVCAESQTDGIQTTGAFSPATVDEAAYLMTKSALKSFPKYKAISLHKAFAQSETGKWAWVGSRTTAEHAVSNALAQCRSNNLKHEDSYPCKVINIDGEWQK